MGIDTNIWCFYGVLLKKRYPFEKLKGDDVLEKHGLPPELCQRIYKELPQMFEDYIGGLEENPANLHIVLNLLKTEKSFSTKKLHSKIQKLSKGCDYVDFPDDEGTKFLYVKETLKTSGLWETNSMVVPRKQIEKQKIYDDNLISFCELLGISSSKLKFTWHVLIKHS